MTPLIAPNGYLQGLWQDILTRIKKAIESCWSKTENIRLVGGQTLSLLSSGGIETIITVNDAGLITTPSYFGAIKTIASGAGTLTLVGGRHYSFTGSTATWTLPAVAGNADKPILIKNRGSGNLTVVPAGSDHIYTTTTVTTITIAAGDSARLVNDGTYWCSE